MSAKPESEAPSASDGREKERRPFVFGRRAGDGWTLWFLGATRAPVRGPWTLTLLTYQD